MHFSFQMKFISVIFKLLNLKVHCVNYTQYVWSDNVVAVWFAGRGVGLRHLIMATSAPGILAVLHILSQQIQEMTLMQWTLRWATLLKFLLLKFRIMFKSMLVLCSNVSCGNLDTRRFLSAGRLCVRPSLALQTRYEFSHNRCLTPFDLVHFHTYMD